ncbi:MAG TPA: PDZ domain-containing protein [Humisphaera sp.]
MRRTRRTLLAGAVLIGCLSTGAFAQQSARDEGPNRPNPPAREGEPRDPREGRDGPRRPDLPDRPQPGGPNGQGFSFRLAPDRPMEKGAYLGVATSPPPPALRQQLGLPGGVGLVVDSIADKSPAAEAGVKRFDVIHKLNDQLLVNQQQLAVLVRTFKPGEAVKLTVIREGKPTELSAKLVERDLPPLDDLRLGMDPFGQPFGQRFEVRPLEGRPFGPDRIDLDVFRRPGGPDRGGDDQGPGARRPFPPGVVNEEFQIAWDDGVVSMTMTARDGRRTLVAKDKDGKELYNGAIDTPEQREKLPPEVRDRLKNVNVQGMFGPGPGGPRQEENRPGANRPGEGRPGEGRPGEVRPGEVRSPATTRPEGENKSPRPQGRQV